MKLAIIGSRSFEDYELLRRTIADLSWRWVSTGPDGEGRNRCQIDEVISGGAEAGAAAAAVPLGGGIARAKMSDALSSRLPSALLAGWPARQLPTRSGG